MAQPMMSLTKGAIQTIISGELSPESDLKPIVQVSDIKPIFKKEENEVARYRLMLSDGVTGVPGMLAIQHNELVANEFLKHGSLIKLVEFVRNYVKERVIIILVNIEVVLTDCEIIGNTRAGGDNVLPVMNAPLMPSQAKNQPVERNYVRPPYGGSNSGPRPNIVGGNSYGGSPVTNPAPRPNVGGSPYGGNPGMNLAPRTNLGSNSYGGSAVPVPTYQETDYASGVSRAPANTNIRLPPPFTNQPQPSASNNQRSTLYNQHQRPAMYANRGPEGKNEAGTIITPISKLTPYQGRWTIKARVTVKTELRTYNNAKGDGKVFSFDLLDSEGGEIRATCFNDVAGRFYNVIEQGGVYMISKGSLKPANKKFNHLVHDYEILLDAASTVEPCNNCDNSIPKLQWHFCRISEIEKLDSGKVLDVMGVVTSIDKPRSITKKDGNETLKRTLQMKDMSGKSVEITMWGNFCESEGSALENLFDSGTSPVLALKSGRVNDFNGKSVGTIASSQLFINPELSETLVLKAWFDREGKTTTAVSLSRELNVYVPKVISQINDESLGTSDKADCIAIPATVSFIKVENFCYTACPLENNGRQCNKKVIDNGDGKYQCDNCHKELEKCDYRYILQMQIQDHTGSTWVTAFQESGVEIMGISAEALLNLQHGEQDDQRFRNWVYNVLFTKFTFKLKVKKETYMDESRVKSTVVKAEKSEFKTATGFLLDSITKIEQGYSSSLPLHVPGNTISAPRESGIYTNQVSPYGKSQITVSNVVSTGSASYTNSTNFGGTGHNSVNYGTGFGNNNASPGPSVENVPPAYGSGNKGPMFGNNASHRQSVEGVLEECFKCHQTGHSARDCPASGNVPPAHGSGVVGSGMYGMVPNQAGF